MEKRILTFTTIIFLLLVSMPLYATVPPSGGGAPIGGGLFILLGLGVAYAGKKIYDFKKREPEA